jgi:NAD(P)-dependent dehydrogenase (short-subunit alcohol dehydrogenase family)
LDVTDELRFDGRVAVVTGAGSGIGREHALLLASRGAKVVVNDMGWPGPKDERADSPDRADRVVDEIVRAGGVAVSHRGDATEQEDVDSIIGLAVERFGRLDVLVNNAGKTESQFSSVETCPTEEWEPLLISHLRGPVMMARAAWPQMVEQGYGRILNTGSAAALGGWRHSVGFNVQYAAPKAALFAVTRQLAHAGKPHGIHTNMIMPWAFTPGSSSASSSSTSPLGEWMRRYASPDKCAAAVLWFNHESCPVNGEAISAAGGRVARITFAQPRGYFNPDLQPEDVRDHWAAIQGNVDEGGELHGFLEIDQPTEWEQLQSLLGPAPAPEP